MFDITLVFPHSKIPDLPDEIEIPMPCVPRKGEILRWQGGSTIGQFDVLEVTYIAEPDGLTAIEVVLGDASAQG